MARYSSWKGYLKISLVSIPVKAKEAVDAYQRAVALDPEYADAPYGLAETLDRQQRFAEARRHWRALLPHEAAGAYADYARQRLAQLA